MMIEKIREVIKKPHTRPKVFEMEKFSPYKKGGPVEPKTIIVHLSHEEQTLLDAVQGGRLIDPATGRRSYVPMSGVIKNPLYREILEESFHRHKGKDDEFSRLDNVAKKSVRLDTKYKSVPGDSNPAEEEIDRLGTQGDDSWSLMPVDVANFLDKLHGRKKNPNTSFRMYGGKKGLERYLAPAARIIGGLVGGTYGGWMGAGAGAGLATAATGGNRKEILQNALIGGATSFAAPHIANSFGDWLPTSVTKGLNAYGRAGNNAPITYAGSQPGTNTAAQTAASTAASSTPSTALPSWLLPAALGAGALYFGKKGGDEYEQKERERERKYEEEREKDRRQSGYYEPLENPPTRIRKKYGLPFKKGGTVDSSLNSEIRSFQSGGTGQSDDIPATMNSGDWIVDASTTSDIGDGDTNAGRRKLARLKEIATATPQKYAHSKNPPAQEVPVKISSGEEGLDRNLVIRLGGGNLNKGSARLKEMTENIRRHKISNKLKLPPKALPLEKYLPKLR